jgi:hypothetical protein
MPGQGRAIEQRRLVDGRVVIHRTLACSSATTPFGFQGTTVKVMGQSDNGSWEKAFEDLHHTHPELHSRTVPKAPGTAR